MNKLLIAMILSFHLPAMARDCGPKSLGGKKSLITFIECSEKDSDCLELKDFEGNIIKLERSSKIALEVVSAVYKKSTVSLTFSSSAACWFEQITEKNTGKRMAIVSNDVILFAASIQSKISGGKVEIGAPKDQDTREFCIRIFGKCKEDSTNAIKDSKPAPGSALDMFANPPRVDRVEENKKYGHVMESAIWVTDKDFLTFYKTSALKGGEIKPIVMNVKENKKTPLFFGRQVFDQKTKKFVFTNKAIHLTPDGWVKREDVVPYNVLSLSPTPGSSEKIIVTHLLKEKCSNEFKLLFEKLQKGSASELMSGEEEIFRSTEVAFIAVKGDGAYVSTYEKIKNEISKRTCKELMR